MLKIIIEDEELYDEESNTFQTTERFEFEVEHSLLSLSKWEANYKKPFLSSGKLSTEEIFQYVMYMILTPNVTEKIVNDSSTKIFSEVNDYINSSQSATTFGEMPQKRGPGEVITSELIYYWMVAFNIPFECEKWHLNRLFSLIRICNIKNSKPEKVSRHEAAMRNRALNEKRKAELNTTG